MLLAQHVGDRHNAIPTRWIPSWTLRGTTCVLYPRMMINKFGTGTNWTVGARLISMSAVWYTLFCICYTRRDSIKRAMTWVWSTLPNPLVAYSTRAKYSTVAKQCRNHWVMALP